MSSNYSEYLVIHFPWTVVISFIDDKNSWRISYSTKNKQDEKLYLEMSKIFTDDQSPEFKFDLNMNIDSLWSRVVPETPIFDWSASAQDEFDLSSKYVFWNESIQKVDLKSKETMINSFGELNLDFNEKVNHLMKNYKSVPTQQSEECCSDKLEYSEVHSNWAQTACDNGLQNKSVTCIQPLQNFDYEEKPKRWGKAEDKYLYERLLQYLTYAEINIEDLSYPQSMSNINHYKMLLNLKRELRWVGTTRQILKRICILKWNPKLSVRDKRKLRRILREQIDQNSINFQEIIYEFPFKDVRELKSIFTKFLSK